MNLEQAVSKLQEMGFTVEEDDDEAGTHSVYHPKDLDGCGAPCLIGWIEAKGALLVFGTDVSFFFTNARSALAAIAMTLPKDTFLIDCGDCSHVLDYGQEWEDATEQQVRKRRWGCDNLYGIVTGMFMDDTFAGPSHDWGLSIKYRIEDFTAAKSEEGAATLPEIVAKAEMKASVYRARGGSCVFVQGAHTDQWGYVGHVQEYKEEA